jgi:hypothetical protein
LKIKPELAALRADLPWENTLGRGEYDALVFPWCSKMTAISSGAIICEGLVWFGQIFYFSGGRLD